MKGAYYNEFDPKTAAWLRELIKQGHITPGDVDERSIEDVRPDELRSYARCHFFAGIGVWDYALNLAGWGDRPVWTGSEPCQPHSTAGKGLGVADERYLRPAWHHLIKHGKRAGIPVYGEQVSDGGGMLWLDTLQNDMEEIDHEVRTLDISSASIGAPHRRQRFMWMANTKCHGRWQQDDTDATPGSLSTAEREESSSGFGSGGGTSIMGDMQRKGLERHTGHGNAGSEPGRLDSESSRSVAEAGDTRFMGDAEGISGGLAERSGGEYSAESFGASEIGRPGPVNGSWRNADWLLCRDGKWRSVESGTFPLAHGSAARVVRLRGYGNAINAAQAAAFIKISM